MSDKSQQVNVIEIMKKIREEIDRYKNYYKDSDIFLSENKPMNHAHREMFELQRLKLPEFEISDSYKHDSDDTHHINDFFSCNNAEFIQKAFNIIYARDPHPAEIDNLMKRLEKGITRTYILGRMRYSSQGRKIGTRMKGLAIPFLVHSIYRVPIFGDILRLIVNILRLPNALADISSGSVELSSRYGALVNHINVVSGLINDRFNSILNKLEAEINHLITFKESDSHRLNDLSTFIRKEFIKINDQLTHIKDEMEIPNQSSIPDEMYFELEEQFRGTREQIKERQRVYLAYVKAAEAGKSYSPILDIGCGRGEWLELCNAEKLVAFGVDINGAMISRCLEFGLKVIKGDALEYLMSQADSSIGAITGFHLIEHLKFAKLVSMLKEAHRVLRPNGILILETPNPENLVVGACNFYIDPTHIKPIPSVLLEGLIKEIGFMNVEVKRLNIYEYYDHIFDNGTNEEFAKLFSGAQDYMILGYKT